MTKIRYISEKDKRRGNGSELDNERSEKECKEEIGGDWREIEMMKRLSFKFKYFIQFMVINNISI